MKINSPIDSNAIALDLRNFGLLPPHLTRSWMIGLSAVEESNLEHPSKAIVEIINSCNLDCPMCRVGQYGVNLKRVLPLDKFIEVINQINGLKIVRLNGLGESTLAPNFEQYTDFLFRKNIKVELITNGSGKLEYYENILKNNGSVFILWDAAEKEIFEELRRPAKWDIFVKKIERLTQNTDKQKLNNISLLFTLQEKNINQLSKLVLKCVDWKISKIIVNVIKDNDCNWGEEKMLIIENEIRSAAELAQEKNIKLFIPSQIFGNLISLNETFQTNDKKCEMPWKEVVIRWNGDVQVCNMFNPFVYGNIYLNSFNEIWNNLFANLFRKIINTQKKHPYCENCVYFEEGYE